MKLRDIKAIPWRIKILITRRFEWIDRDNKDSITVTHETWDMAWAVAGIHSHNWWWVNKYGKLSCGCTRNPLTRKVIMINMDCPEHCSFYEEWERIKNEDDRGIEETS
jgi:hypothetical protein